MTSSSGKKLIQIDVSADTVCPWCFVGKKNLDKAIASSESRYEFEIKWHPYMLNPNAPKDGYNKKEHYLQRYGPRIIDMDALMPKIFEHHGMDYNISELTGNTLDSHRLIYFAGTQGPDKQHKLVEELYLGCFTQGKYIGDREFLVETAEKVGLEGAAEFLEDPNNGLQEVGEDLKRYSVHGIPRYVINGKCQMSGGQSPGSFLAAFQAASSD